jgi:hypothetical protein
MGRLLAVLVATLAGLGIQVVPIGDAHDGIVPPREVGTVVAGQPAPDPAPEPGPDPATCPLTPHGVVVDRAAQRAWLCDAGVVVRVMPITSAADQPDPAVYEIYAEDLRTTSYYGPRPSVLDHFVAFTRGKYEGARIGFHAVPRYADDTLAQPLESVGTPELFGASSGCIRLRPEDALALWDFVAVGDQVHVIT